MQYRPLGRTGVQVSPLCLGAMSRKPEEAAWIIARSQPSPRERLM